MAETSIPAAPAPSRLDHMTLRCAPAQLAQIAEFYCKILRFEPGPRPDFDFPGCWLYTQGQAVVHLAAVLQNPGADAPSSSSIESRAGVDHVAFRSTDLDTVRNALIAQGVRFEEMPVPDWPLWQIFLRDPVGTKIELTFELAP